MRYALFIFSVHIILLFNSPERLLRKCYFSILKWGIKMHGGILICVFISVVRVKIRSDRELPLASLCLWLLLFRLYFTSFHFEAQHVWNFLASQCLVRCDTAIFSSKIPADPLASKKKSKLCTTNLFLSRLYKNAHDIKMSLPFTSSILTSYYNITRRSNTKSSHVCQPTIFNVSRTS